MNTYIVFRKGVEIARKDGNEVITYDRDGHCRFNILKNGYLVAGYWDSDLGKISIMKEAACEAK